MDRQNTMKTTCLINNYNYGKYVTDAVNSALAQSIEFDEVVVVDDGSTDNSKDILKSNFSDHSKVKLVFKENGGQLSCFIEGFSVSTGDIIFFLDSDDVYHEDYLKKSLNFYHQHQQCDFLFCAHEDFGEFGSKVRRKHSRDGDLGYSVILAMYSDDYIVGNVTSTLSARRWILNNIFPLPLVKEFRVRADDCLVFGSSILGARKFYFTEPLVKRRIHGDNDSLKYDNLQTDSSYCYKRELNLNRLRQLMFDRMHYGVQIFNLMHYEFKTIQHPSFFIFKLYLGIIISSLDIDCLQKLLMTASIVKHFSTTFISTRIRQIIIIWS